MQPQTLINATAKLYAVPETDLVVAVTTTTLPNGKTQEVPVTFTLPQLQTQLMAVNAVLAQLNAAIALVTPA